MVAGLVVRVERELQLGRRAADLPSGDLPLGVEAARWVVEHLPGRPGLHARPGRPPGDRVEVDPAVIALDDDSGRPFVEGHGISKRPHGLDRPVDGFRCDTQVKVAVRASLPAQQRIDAPPAGDPGSDAGGLEGVEDPEDLGASIPAARTPQPPPGHIWTCWKSEFRHAMASLASAAQASDSVGPPTTTCVAFGPYMNDARIVKGSPDPDRAIRLVRVGRRRRHLGRGLHRLDDDGDAQRALESIDQVLPGGHLVRIVTHQRVPSSVDRFATRRSRREPKRSMIR